MMQYKKTFLITLTALCLVGCGKSDDSSGKAAAPAPTKKAPKADGGDSSTAAPPPAPAPADAPAPGSPPPAVPGGAAAPNTAAVNGLVVTKDSDGATLPGEKIIYKAIEIYVEGKGKPYPKSLDEVVQSGVLTALPEAPEGKKWVLQGNKVVLQ